MLTEKKVSKSGTISIPVHTRRALGINAGEKVNVKVNDDGNLLIERIEGSCIFCHCSENLKKVNKIYVCVDCAKEVLVIFGKEDLC